MNINHRPIRVFVVEDDPIYVKLIRYVMTLNPDYEVHIFSNGKSCLEHLHLNPSIITLDYSLPDMTGKVLLRKIRDFNKEIEIIVLSGQNDVSIAVDLLKERVHDYLVKDANTMDRLHNSLRLLQNKLVLKQEVEQLRGELGDKYDLRKYIIGNSKSMQRVTRLIEKAIRTNITVSITGETGSGKEVVAKSIHYNSNRRNNNFVAVNVSAIPKDLIESELFGYEKGAFTGANTRKLGQFEQANQGTLFLDEIAELDINLQAKLLRAIQEREITRIGGSGAIAFDARIIVATHKDLQEEVLAGRFREDLYYRLLGLPIEVPPLRERESDILLLMRHFLNEFCHHNKLPKIGLSKPAKEKLMNYHYPGNVRELKAIIELAAVMSENQIIEEEDIRFNSPHKATNFLTKEMSLKEYNRTIIKHFLTKYDRDVLLVAQKLDIGKSTIYRMMKEENWYEPNFK